MTPRFHPLHSLVKRHPRHNELGFDGEDCVLHSISFWIVKEASILGKCVEIVTQRDKLVEKVLDNGATNNVTFDELCRCAVHMGWKAKTRTGTSHVIYWHEKCPDLLNFQPGRDGKAKPYQVRQLRNFINSVNFLSKLNPPA